MSAAPPSVAHGDESGSGAAGPGRLLRSARESAGIGLRDVAAQMHLDERTMTALENDAFGELPASTFVRGYLRGYARLLGVPVGPVMEAYDREGFTPPDLVADIAEKPQANSGDFPVRVTTYVVVLVLAALVVVWWHNQGFDEPVAMAPPPEAAPGPVAPEPGAPGPVAPDPLVSSPPAQTAQAAPDPPATPIASTAPDTLPQTSGMPSDASTAMPAADSSEQRASTPPTAASGSGSGVDARVEQMLSEAERVLERTRSDIDAAARVPTAEPARETADTGDSPPATPSAPSVPAADAATRDAGTRDAGAPDGQSPAAPSSTARLRASFPEEAWVEIYDRNDERLFYNLVAPGRELELQGEPPIRVLLGRTRGVQVEYNGQPVDLEPHTERGVARFTLQ